MKIVSWNINALKAHEKAFRYAVDLLQPDVFCLQEIRTREDLHAVHVKGYRSYMNPAKQSQHFGTGIYIKNDIRPMSITFDPPFPDYEYQGRVMAMEFGKFVLVNSYWPFSMRSKDNNGLKYRLEWCNMFQEFVHKLQTRKPVAICGDMNIVRFPFDAYDGKSIKKQPCFYPEEHDSFEKLIEVERLVDVHRYKHPCPHDNPSGEYTAWAYSKDDVQRNENQGFRLDYFLVSESIIKYVKESHGHSDILGSDHCPISIELEI